jgi:hypothetical protein
LKSRDKHKKSKEKAKKGLDSASYKLYYVNYKMGMRGALLRMMWRGFRIGTLPC